jgi:uncharacterized protein YjbI with pentapeptide repeats
MLEYKKEDFDRMLLEDKNKVIEDLKKVKMVKLFYSQQRFFCYKIFDAQVDDLFLKKEDEGLLEGETKPMILADIDFNDSDILRENFRFWYFLGDEISFYKSRFHGKQTNFSLSNFYTERTDFFASDFKAERTDFSAVEFRNKHTSFSESRFYGKQTYFLGANFYGVDADFSKGVFHAKHTDFSKAVFECKRLSFYNSDFMEYANLEVKKFADINIFTNSTYRTGASFNIEKLCRDENKLTRPDKLILGNPEKTKDNLYAVKKLLNQNERFDQADYILYWSKVFERRANKSISRKLIFPLEWLFLDKMTGYFTKAEKVLLTIFYVFTFFFMIYILAIVCNNETIGKLLINKVSLSSILYDGNLPVIYKFKTVIGNILYYNFVTYSTIGFGDIVPTGFMKIITGIEGFTGTLLNALFLIVLTRKVLR